MRKLSCDPTLEIVGQTVISFVENTQAEEIHPYLVKHGLDKIQPDQWYPAAAFLDMINDMAEGTNLTSNLVAIGMQIPLKMIVPPEMEKASLQDILYSWDALYKLQHRGPGEMGYVKAETISPTHIVTVHHHIYPDDFTYGIAYGMAKRWLPKKAHFKVKYDDQIPSMDNGGNETVIHVIWD